MKRNSKHPSVQVVCRLNGETPTLRDRWVAFYRLWRCARKQLSDPMFANEVADSFRILAPGWTWLVNMEVRDVSRVHLPKFLRRRMIQDERRRRLYGNHPEWKERDKVVARQVRQETGVEVTPDEVAETRRKVINLARAKGRELGMSMPEDDEDVLKMLNKGNRCE